MDRRSYLRALIGKPYVAGATGPAAFDCAGLATAVCRDLFGLVLPDRAQAPTTRRAWRQVAMPVDGAVVMMRQDDTHIGVWLREGGVIHALKPSGVVFDGLAALSLRRLGEPRFYVPA